MRRFLKVLAWLMLIVLVIIQFFHPKKNVASGEQQNALAKLHAVPDDVNLILKKACNDCHSNNTAYPWYSKLQPIDWWLDKHVTDGKRHLNFDELGARPAWLRYHKMEEVIEQVKKGQMPIDSYLWTHKDAILTSEEKAKLTSWAQGIMDQMKQSLPADSLVRPKRPEPPKS